MRRIFFQPASHVTVRAHQGVDTLLDLHLAGSVLGQHDAAALQRLLDLAIGQAFVQVHKALHHGVGQGHVGSHESDHAANAGGQLVAVVVVAGGIQGAIDAIVHLLVIEGRGVGCAGVELNALILATQPIR